MSTATLVRNRGYDLGVLPAFAYSAVPKRGMKSVNLRALGILPGIGGGDGRGYNAADDLVTQSGDGTDLNEFWDLFQSSMQEQNAIRQTLVDFLTFPVTKPMDQVAQISSADFEKSSEFGEPVGVRPATSYFNLGFDLEFYDLAARYTWKFLADAPDSQINAINAMAIEADNRLVFNKVMEALFNNVNREADINGVQDVPVYALYNADGTVPPRYKSNVFDGTHNHYMVSGAATVDSGDIDAMYDNIAEHGYTWENGMRIVLLANSIEVKVIRSFRIANGDSWDFIPSQGSPAIFLPSDQQLFGGGGQQARTLEGLQVAGSYGPIIVLEEDSIPPKYLAMVATGGKANLNNPVGFREHSNASLRGLKLVKGRNPDYPLIDSFYNRGFGTGVRQRGGSVVMKITAGAYTVPTFS